MTKERITKGMLTDQILHLYWVIPPKGFRQSARTVHLVVWTVLWKIKAYYRAIACIAALAIHQCNFVSRHSLTSTQMDTLHSNKCLSKYNCLEALHLSQMDSLVQIKIAFFDSSQLLAARMIEDKRWMSLSTLHILDPTLVLEFSKIACSRLLHHQFTAKVEEFQDANFSTT